MSRHSCNRRLKLAAAATTVVAAAALTGCSSTAATADSSTSGTVTVMAYSGVVQDNYTKAVIEPFEKKYPNITVNYVPAESSSDMLATLRSQKSSPTADVVIMDTSVAATANQEHLFQPLDPAKVPNMKDVAERGQTPGNYGPAVTFDNLVLLYNKDKIKTAPTSWNALWSSQAGDGDAIPAAPDIQGLSLMIIADKMEGANYQQTIQPAVKKLEALAPHVQTWAPNPDTYTMVTNGSATMGIGWNARAQYYSNTSHGKLGVVIPKEGSVFQINTINLVNHDPAPKAAQTFINYALSPQAQKSFTEQMYYAPTNTKTQVSPEAASRTATTPQRQAQMIDVDWNYVAEHNDAWTNIWRRQILGS